MRRAFTLIELLIVVAIIAILAAIAVPNFLEAMTRAKVSRAKADLRTIATGVEAYCADYSKYPYNDGVYNVIPRQLTTPTAYLTTGNLVDPFMDKMRLNDPSLDPELARYYTYTKPVTIAERDIDITLGFSPPPEAVDAPGSFRNPGAFRFYGRWRLVSCAPDRDYSDPSHDYVSVDNPNPQAQRGCDITYDPTNGTVSWGNIHRVQKKTEGFLF